MFKLRPILLAAALLSLAGIGLHAQAAAPAPVKINFTDKGIPVAEKVAAALAAQEGGTANAANVNAAIADPTFGGLVDNAEIRAIAIARKAPPKTSRAARVAHWQAALADTTRPLAPAGRTLTAKTQQARDAAPGK